MIGFDSITTIRLCKWADLFAIIHLLHQVQLRSVTDKALLLGLDKYLTGIILGEGWLTVFSPNSMTHRKDFS